MEPNVLVKGLRLNSRLGTEFYTVLDLTQD